jgi:2-oxoglutarate dehydrogenase E2 component (dihydrolipoamide succinyltransferase)
MKIELKVPEFGESVQEVHIAKWLRREGDRVQRDEDLVELETDKATMELAAPNAGVIVQIVKPAGQIAKIGEVIAYIDDAAVPAAPAAPEAPAATAVQPTSPSAPDATSRPAPRAAEPVNGGNVHATPAARRELRLHGLQPEQVSGGAKRVERQDVLRYVSEQAAAPAPQLPSAPPPQQQPISRAPAKPSSDETEVVPMTLIRRKIAERLVQAQQQAALLTTFNEVDMTAVMELRKRFVDSFKERHGVKLGFMSFFVKATIEALQEFPELNAQIRGTDIVYNKHNHIGVAIGSERGLVVPVLRRAEELSFAQIEQAIGDFAKRAGEGKLLPDELQGGTFTISNGGVYGSLMSTPIVNPPQSGVLGMHSIQERPVARNGQVVIRPMMYLALTYDHRIVDGREAVSFLKRIKDVIEDPTRLMLEV